MSVYPGLLVKRRKKQAFNDKRKRLDRPLAYADYLSVLGGAQRARVASHMSNSDTMMTNPQSPRMTASREDRLCRDRLCRPNDQQLYRTSGFVDLPPRTQVA
ncbi:hypothetical protein MBLNU457_g2443t1 [Dothideomycetes sp. NU457]